jgi:hypothetical protein
MEMEGFRRLVCSNEQLFVSKTTGADILGM